MALQTWPRARHFPGKEQHGPAFEENSRYMNESPASGQNIDFLRTCTSMGTVKVTTSLYLKILLIGDMIFFF